MISISLCMIVRDEEATLKRCLDTAKDLVDEIIIVDTGSIDKTKEIAYDYTDKVYNFEWIDNFAAARNFSFSKATKEYIFYLDADDVILEDDRGKLKKLKETLSHDVDSVTMLYNVGFDKYGNVTFSFKRNRLVKRCRNFKWHCAAHNYLEVSGNIIDSDICITHKKIKSYTDRNLNIYKKLIENGHEFSPRDVFCYGNELYWHGMYDKALEQYEKLLQMGNAWLDDKIFACGQIADYYQSKKLIDKAKEYCFKSFKYDVPRAEFCCKLGFYFQSESKLLQAIFWYEIATIVKKPERSFGFFNNDCWTWLPHLQLCVCYYKLGYTDISYKHNQIALSYSPNHETILSNKKFFQELGYK